MSENKQLIAEENNFLMEDASELPATQTEAQAETKVYFSNGAREIVLKEGVAKEEVVTAAKIAGIQAAKRTSEFIPFHHYNPLTWVDISFEPAIDYIKITASVKALSRAGLEMEALTAASVAGLTIVDLCKDHDRGVNMQDLKLVPKRIVKDVTHITTTIRVGIIVISDRITAGIDRDETGTILMEGFENAGFEAGEYVVIPNDTDKLIDQIQEWLEQDIGLIITAGGNGIGPRDITLNAVEPFFDFRMEGVEQVLHSIAQANNNGFYMDRLAAGKIGKSIVLCLPLDSNLAKSMLPVVLPNIHQAFDF